MERKSCGFYMQICTGQKNPQQITMAGQWMRFYTFFAWKIEHAADFTNLHRVNRLDFVSSDSAAKSNFGRGSHCVNASVSLYLSEYRKKKVAGGSPTDIVTQLLRPHRGD